MTIYITLKQQVANLTKQTTKSHSTKNGSEKELTLRAFPYPSGYKQYRNVSVANLFNKIEVKSQKHVN